MTEPSAWVLNILKNEKIGGNLIDIACGSGRHVKALHNSFCITAVDYNQEALNFLSELNNVKTIFYNLEESNEWPFILEKYKIVLVTNYLYRERLIDLFKMVDKGGLIVYETFSSGNEMYGKPSNPKYLLKTDELLINKPDNFEVVDYFCGEIDHPKKAIIQRLAARRLSISN